jgi:hypothetical protein
MYNRVLLNAQVQGVSGQTRTYKKGRIHIARGINLSERLHKSIELFDVRSSVPSLSTYGAYFLVINSNHQLTAVCICKCGYVLQELRGLGGESLTVKEMTLMPFAEFQGVIEFNGSGNHQVAQS